MSKFEQIYTFYKLREINRVGKTLSGRPVSVEEHLHSLDMLAHYFMKVLNLNLNKEKVWLLIKYHDLPEVYAGDTFILDKEATQSKKEREEKAALKIKKELPEVLQEEFWKCWQEYESCETQEAKFVHAIDALDGIFESLKQPEAWKEYGFTESVLRKYKEPKLKAFPQLIDFFEELIVYLKENKILPEEQA